ncbi:MAG: hypothetical protein SFX72_21765 [Isosphaeraceae bacterium]|nr:hypothetical protein [Isosphaeraceae bacterium]
MDRRIGASYSICVAILIFFAIALKPGDGSRAPENRSAAERPSDTADHPRAALAQREKRNRGEDASLPAEATRRPARRDAAP